MSVALRGDLRDFGISEVFQLIAQQRKTGILQIAGERERIRLVFDAGAIVSASPAGAHEDSSLGELLVRIGWLTRDRLACLERDREQSLQGLPKLLAERGDLSREQVEEAQDLLTSEAIFSVLNWETGSFHFSSQRVAHDRSPARLLGAEQVLMDGMRMVDEWQTFADRVPSDDVVFQRIGRFEEKRSHFEPGSKRQRDAERIFFMVDGRLSARRLIDLSRLGTFDGTRLLAQLRDLDLIEPLAPEQISLVRHRKTPAFPSSPLRFLAAAILPLVVLAGIVLCPRPRSTSTAGSDDLGLVMDPVSVARSLFGTQRLRNAIEAFRFATGVWPEDLGELAARGWVEASALASPAGHPYYYVRRDDGYVLLAPEP